MKKMMFSLGLAAAAASVWADGTVAQTGGRVSFTGEVLASTCAVAAASQDIQVTLPTVESNDLENNVGEKRNFTIELEGCPTGSVLAKANPGKEAISVRFAPNNPLHSNLGVLSNTAAQEQRAENIGVQLLNKDGAPLNFDEEGQNATSVAFSEADTAGGRAQLVFQARLFAGQNLPITAGQVSAATPFVIEYK
ncbi:MAG: fimbrial protein [Neisseria sp.]|nr:fimbrial protein [Neisseria sp.]